MAASVEDKRQQLCRIYCELVACDGPTIVHQMLSRALVEHRGTKAGKPAAPKREAVPRCPTTIEWHGEQLALGEAMCLLAPMARIFVLARVHDGMPINKAALLAGYSGSMKITNRVKAAIAEERARVNVQ